VVQEIATEAAMAEAEVKEQAVAVQALQRWSG
jgi:hypothetical protein